MSPRRHPLGTMELSRVDLRARPQWLPISLVDAIEADGGLWSAGDYYTDADAVVARAREVGARALRLDFRDLSLLESLPEVRYLHLSSDGMPAMDPVASLRGLRALIIETKAMRGALDPLSFPDLRWLKVSVGGKGGLAVLPSILRGHPRLEYLSIAEMTFRTVAELCPGFPSLRVLKVVYGDRLRSLGSMDAVAASLRVLDLHLTAIRSLDGAESLANLEALSLFGAKVTDLTPLRGLQHLRYALLLTAVASLRPLAGHPSLRMLELLQHGQDEDLSVLDTLPNLVAVGRGKSFVGETRFPDINDLARDDPLRLEWLDAFRG
jgi:hypothetical protein